MNKIIFFFIIGAAVAAAGAAVWQEFGGKNLERISAPSAVQNPVENTEDVPKTNLPPANTVSGFANDQIGKAIGDYLLAQNNFSWKTQDDSFNFCAAQNLDPKNELFPFYVWAYCAEYGMENGKLKLLSGTSMPVKINYPNELSFYDIGKFSHEAPRDGSFNDEDIARIFPETARQGFSGFDREGMANNLEATALVVMLSWESIKRAIADCQAAKAFQNHDRDVSLELKDGSKITGVEPKIDGIITIIKEAETKCGRIQIGTE